MSDIILNSKAKITQANYSFVFSMSDDDACYKLSLRDIALISSHIEMFAWKTRWHGGQYQELTQSQNVTVRELVDNLVRKLFTPVDCGGNSDPPKDPPKDPPTLSYVKSLENRISELEQEIEEMACKCELRWKDGVLQMLDASCGCEWIDVPTEGQKTPNPISPSLGASVGFSMVNEDGAAKDISVPLEKSNLNADAVELRACSKATALVKMFRNVIQTAIMSDIREALDTIPFPTTSIVSAITNAIAPAFLPVVGAFKLASMAADITDPIAEEIQDKLNAKNEAQAICTLYPLISKGYELTGEDIANTILSIGFKAGDASFLVVNALTQSMSLKAIKEHLELKFSDVDCGCPDIVDKANYSPLSAPQKPSAAVWSVEANLKTGQHGTRLFEIANPQWGEYQSGVGYVNSSFDFEDVPDARQYTRILIDWENLSGRILRVDWFAENVTEGLFQSNTGTPNADVEKFLVYVSPDQQTRQYVDNGAGWRSANFGQTFANIDLWWLWGYCEISSNDGGQTSLGGGTVSKIRIHGTGTKPSWFSSNGWTDV